MSYHLRLFFLLLLAAQNIQAQQCTEPAEPVAVITFGSEDVPFSLAGKLGATYKTTDETCTPKGTIAVRNKAFLCKPEWLVVPGDHTRGDNNGNFLMVSSGEGATEVYRDTVSGLCPDIMFFTEMWAVNLMRKSACDGAAADPDLYLVLTDLAGNKLAEGSSGKIAKSDFGSWVPFRLQFVCPPDGQVVLRIGNRSGASCGSDFGLDDISFAPCKRALPALLQGAVGNELKVCQEAQKPYLLQSSFGSSSNPAVQWQVNANDSGWQDLPGATGATFSRQPTGWGIYQYRVKLLENGNAGCRFTSDVSQIVVYPQPFAQGTNYVFGCYGYPFKFQGAGGNAYDWRGPSGFSSAEQAPVIPNLDFKHAGRYVVKVTTNAGCIGYDSTDLVVYEAPVAGTNILDTALCLGDSVRLQAAGAQRYLWRPAAGLSSDTVANPVARPEKTTQYTVMVYRDQTCFDTASINVRVLPLPAAFAGPDRFARKNKPLQLEGKVLGDAAVTYKWTPAQPLNNPRLLRPQAKLSETTLFRLEATAGNGCGTAYDEVLIEVIDGLFIPTAFTPNSDFVNDKWEITGMEDYPAAVVRVYNRWGEAVYESTSSKYKPWNGKYKTADAVPGVYLYVLDLGNGTPLRKGALTLLK